jgi:rSAM/selenodomain-associated transferase 2
MAAGRSLALVVPVLNERADIDGLCERLANAARDCEVVVVDGGSDDGTDDLLHARASRAGFCFLTSSRGRGAQMNAGAAATTAGTLLFLHADTRLPTRGTAAVERAVEDGAIGGCFKLSIDSADPRLRAASGLINLRSRILCSATGDQAIFVQRDVFERVGGYRDIPLCEDLDLVYRLRGLGHFALLEERVHTSARRWQRGGVTRTISLMWALRIGWHLGVDPQRLSRWYRQDAR